MTNEGEPIPVDQPGEDLPSGTTFADVFGLVFTEEGKADYITKMKRIDENERQAAIVGRTIVIGSSEPPIVRPSIGSLSDIMGPERA